MGIYNPLQVALKMCYLLADKIRIVLGIDVEEWKSRRLLTNHKVWHWLHEQLVGLCHHNILLWNVSLF